MEFKMGRTTVSLGEEVVSRFITTRIVDRADVPNMRRVLETALGSILKAEKVMDDNDMKMLAEHALVYAENSALYKYLGRLDMKLCGSAEDGMFESLGVLMVLRELNSRAKNGNDRGATSELLLLLMKKGYFKGIDRCI
jgi:hypothetical protein